MNKLFLRISLLFVLINIPSYSQNQSVSLSIGSSYYYVLRSSDYNYFDNNLEQFLIQYNYDIGRNLQMSVMAGYGWTNYNYHFVTYSYDFGDFNKFNIQAKGFPAAFELIYKHYIASDSVFEPFIGIGIGYCNLKSIIKHTYPPFANDNQYGNLTTEGFSQYMSLGMNFRMANNISSFFKIQKEIFSNIKTSGNLSTFGYPYPESFKEDYSSSSNYSSIAITFGITICI
ncbi:MAG TPA: hypothetical protein VMV32_04170 [Ignavibacteriaceae bacterium]|nr:hypothetical protein [Ignavibacteriaceae bacterium]